MGIDTGKGEVELDVLIRDTATGIECKCYTRNIAVGKSMINRETQRLKRQIENYVQVGIRRVFVVTNLSDADSTRLQDALGSQLQGLDEITEFKVLSANMTAFRAFLEEEAKLIGKAATAQFETELEHKIAQKQLKPSSGKAR